MQNFRTQRCPFLEYHSLQKFAKVDHQCAPGLVWLKGSMVLLMMNPLPMNPELIWTGSGAASESLLKMNWLSVELWQIPIETCKH
jgi:hypothetical protein